MNHIFLENASYYESSESVDIQLSKLNDTVLCRACSRVGCRLMAPMAGAKVNSTDK